MADRFAAGRRRTDFAPEWPFCQSFDGFRMPDGALTASRMLSKLRILKS
jgi:hypothetical protein